MTATAPPGPEAGARQPEPGRARRWWARVRGSAWRRIGVFMALAGALSLAIFSLVKLLGWADPEAPAALRVPAVLVRQLLPTLGAYWLLVRWIEGRGMTELSPRAMLPGLALGAAGGALLIASVFGVLWIAGAYEVRGWGSGEGWAYNLLVLGLGTAIAEEVVFRGVFYRLVAQWRGDMWALAVSALLFGALHLGNPHATLWTSFAIAVEAGVLLGVVYAVTLSLWPCIGLHMAWNFLEGTAFGSPVSGTASPAPLLDSVFSGPDWLTGGTFGIEASVVTVALSLIASLSLLALRRRSAPPATPAPEGATPC